MPDTPRPKSDDPALTAVRGIAALWVFFYHAWVTAGPQLLLIAMGAITIDLTPLASIGWAGVDVFYVLSGFLLFGIFDDWASGRRASVDLKRYAERRALRILPPYYAQLALLAGLGYATALIDRPSLGNIVSHVLLIHGWLAAHQVSMNGVWWTLSIEAQFYVTLPLIAWLIRRSGWPVVIVGGLLVVLAWRMGAFHLVRDAPVPQRVWLIEQFPGRIDQFLFGMYAQHLARAPDPRATRLREWLAGRRSRYLLAVATGPAVLIALGYLLHVDSFFVRYWDGHPWLFFWHMAVGVGVATTLYALAVRGSVAAPKAAHSLLGKLSGRALVGIGTISYSFYLWHEVLLRWIGPPIVRAFGGEGTLPVLGMMVAAGFAVSVAAAMLWYALFERPFLRQRARLRKESAPATAPAGAG